MNRFFKKFILTCKITRNFNLPTKKSIKIIVWSVTSIPAVAFIYRSYIRSG